MRARGGQRGVKLYRNVRSDPTRSAFHEGKKGWDGSWSLRRVVPSGKAVSGKLTFNLINAAMSCSFFPFLCHSCEEGRVSAPFPPFPLLTAIPLPCKISSVKLARRPRRSLIKGVELVGGKFVPASLPILGLYFGIATLSDIVNYPFIFSSFSPFAVKSSRLLLPISMKRIFYFSCQEKQVETKIRDTEKT